MERSSPSDPDVANTFAQLQAALADRYGLERELGHGGMATVYLARDLRHGRPVAIKVLRPEIAAALGPERFLREIQIAAQLAHPHILPLHDSGAAGAFLYYVMPYVEGESLRDRLAREPQLPVEQAVQIAREVADALGYAHGHDVVHRDIKPENILFEAGHAVVSDFGIARAITATAGARLTETGIVIGTPAYMSPEQASGTDPIDGRSDVYSLGCVLYEMLAGEPPYTGPSAQIVISKRLTDPVPSVRRLREGIPGAIDAAVSRALAKAAADRFATAALFAEALAAPPAIPAPVHPSRRGRPLLGRRLAYGVGLAALAVLAAIGIFPRSPARSGTSHPSPQRMLVVLPFENLGRPDDEYFADGMTEEVTARLAGLHGLRVVGRTSARQYKKTTKTIPQIGQDLGVDYVLEGSVRWDKPPRGPSRVRVTPQLIRVSDASHVWAHVYDAVLADVFAVQSNIARQVAETLDVTLLAPERQALDAKPTTNLEAYDYYLRGKDYQARQLDDEDARLAVRMYRQAVQLDPTFALAYAALARAHLALSWLLGETGELPKAQAALDRAQRLGPELAEIHLALGYYYYWGRRDYDHALEQFAWVRERQPNNPEVIEAIGLIHRRQGRWAEVVSDMTRATELDPRNHESFAGLGQTYLVLRRYPEADRAFARAASLAPDVRASPVARAHVSLLWNGDATKAHQVLRQAGTTVDSVRLLVDRSPDSRVFLRVFASDYGKALAHSPLRAAGGDTASYYLAKAEYYDLSSETSRAHAYFDSARVVLEAKMATRPANKASEQWPVEMPLGLAYAGLGRRADAIRLGRQGAELVPVSRDALAGPLMLFGLAEIYILAGEYEAALDQLEYLLSIPSPLSIPLLRVDPLYAPLRGNPRFQRLVAGQ